MSSYTKTHLLTQTFNFVYNLVSQAAEVALALPAFKRTTHAQKLSL